MKKYNVTVFMNGQNVGTYTVEEPDEWKARTMAMAKYLWASDAGEAPAMKSGASMSYDVKEV